MLRIRGRDLKQLLPGRYNSHNDLSQLLPGSQTITTRVRDGTMALRMASTRLGVIVLLGLLRRIRKVANLYHMVLCLIV